MRRFPSWSLFLLIFTVAILAAFVVKIAGDAVAGDWLGCAWYALGVGVGVSVFRRTWNNWQRAKRVILKSH